MNYYCTGIVEINLLLYFLDSYQVSIPNILKVWYYVDGFWFMNFKLRRTFQCLSSRPFFVQRCLLRPWRDAFFSLPIFRLLVVHHIYEVQRRSLVRLDLRLVRLQVNHSFRIFWRYEDFHTLHKIWRTVFEVCAEDMELQIGQCLQDSCSRYWPSVLGHSWMRMHQSKPLICCSGQDALLRACGYYLNLATSTKFRIFSAFYFDASPNIYISYSILFDN